MATGNIALVLGYRAALTARSATASASNAGLSAYDASLVADLTFSSAKRAIPSASIASCIDDPAEPSARRASREDDGFFLFRRDDVALDSRALEIRRKSESRRHRSSSIGRATR